MYLLFKWIFDRLTALIAIILLIPVFIILSIFVKLTSKGPILFKQKRVGKNKKIFTMYKFRSMKITAPSDKTPSQLENPNFWITKIGRILRKTSLDELPQLFNILKGDMSIIGYRPSQANEIELINERDKYNVHDLRPGITGYAQINGRDITAKDVVKKAKLDGYYREKIGFWMDFKIFFKTIPYVLLRKGIKEGSDDSKEKKDGVS